MKVIPNLKALTNKKIVNGVKNMSDVDIYQLFENGSFEIRYNGDFCSVTLNKNVIVVLDWEKIITDSGEERYFLLYKGKRTETLIYKEKGDGMYECRYSDTYYLNLLTDNWCSQSLVFSHLRSHNLVHLQAIMQNEFRKWKLYCKIMERDFNIY